jgi:hypothetical protein
MVDPRGKLKTGMRIRTSEGKEYPKSLEYFNVEKFAELKEAYGEKPAMFVVMFPSDEPPNFFDCNFEHWGGRKQAGQEGTLIRRCDGETCLHRINETIAGKSYGAGEESGCVCQGLKDDDKQRCRYTAYLKAWIVNPHTNKIENPKCYLFETHSQNSGDAIYSALNDVRILTGGALRGIPFSLSVKMVSGKEDAKQKFPIWSLLPLGTVSQMREHARQLSGTVIKIPLLSEAPQAVEDPVKKASAEIVERYMPRIKSTATAPDLTRIKDELFEFKREGKLTESDHEELTNQMKSRYQEIIK